MRAGLAASLAVAVAVAGCGSDSPPFVATSPAPTKSVTRTTKPRPRPARPGTAPADPSLPRDVAVPVLMYHVINTPPEGTPFPELWVPAGRFAAEMKALARAGYHGVTLTEVDEHWRRGAPLPSKPLVVSFDDGYLSHYRAAAPVLRRLQWPGVLNMAVHNLDAEGGLSPRMVRALIADGWELGAHTINHLDLTQVDASTLRHEVLGSRRVLRRRFHVPVNFFSYPAGRLDASALAAVQAAGFHGATTVEAGLARPDQRFELRRIRVNGSDTPDAVLARVHVLGA